MSMRFRTSFQRFVVSSSACAVPQPRSGARTTRDFLSVKLGTLEHEVFSIIFLDKRHRVMSYSELFRGTIDGASVGPPLLHSASAPP
jgi:DNA repair protein RadC